MGCSVTKQLQALGDECRRSSTQLADPSSTTTLATAASTDHPAAAAVASPTGPSMPANAQQTKARLERLMCVARETPEPVFELPGCNLKSVPAGVFILCKVLRKERLNLAGNRLRTLSDGGAVADLMLLTHLDLSGNAFEALPAELAQLVNLQV